MTHCTLDHVFVPDPYRVVARRQETDDVVTLSLEPADTVRRTFEAGQFNMLTAFGIGEVAISISSAPGDVGPLQHTVRAVGAVSRALCAAPVGSMLGLRGPFGTNWALPSLQGKDVIVVAGGIGLAPLRGLVRSVLDDMSVRHLTVLIGARAPDQLVFVKETQSWNGRGAEVKVTVDVAAPDWDGNVGVVTTLIDGVAFEPEKAIALVCGPEVMIRFTARALVDRGISEEQILVSLERNMQCGLGLCGHCQLGPFLICRDGPVFRYGQVRDLLMERER